MAPAPSIATVGRGEVGVMALVSSSPDVPMRILLKNSSWTFFCGPLYHRYLNRHQALDALFAKEVARVVAAGATSHAAVSSTGGR